MFLRRLPLLLLLSLPFPALAQQNEFCDAITAIARDAPARFRNVRGKMVDAASRKGVWECSIRVPGTVASRFVQSMGLFYEAALYQAKTQAGLGTAYERAKKQLADCLAPQGYNVSYQPNLAPGLGALKKVVFMKEPGLDFNVNNAPAHFALEALYSKEMGTYTVVFYIFEH